MTIILFKQRLALGRTFVHGTGPYTISNYNYMVHTITLRHPSYEKVPSFIGSTTLTDTKLYGVTRK